MSGESQVPEDVQRQARADGPAPPETGISAEFPYESHYIDVLGSKMHYIEEGDGDPILFLHGQPTSSYLWRNIIPHVAHYGRCIAPDLIGMGKSDKPDIPYRFPDHIRYVDAFIEAMGLDEVTLVIHDWGSGLGFQWAHKHPDRVRGIAFMEAIIGPMTWAQFPPGFAMGFRLFRTPGVGWLMLSAGNMFLTQVMPQATVRELTKEEMAVYRAPFARLKDRRPMREWPRQIPIEGKPADNHEIIAAYHAWLKETEVPKLLLAAEPGGLLPPKTVAWCAEHMPNLEVVQLGQGMHYVQEDHPNAIGNHVARWFVETVQGGTWTPPTEEVPTDEFMAEETAEVPAPT